MGEKLWMDFLAFDLEQLPYVIVVLLIAFTVHEFAHAYVAYKFGDLTAKNEGRVTLNPVSHLDPVGTIFILLFGFGWARPVPVNRFYFKNPRLAGILVSFAGPFSNLVVASIGYFVWYGLLAAGVEISPLIVPFFEMLIWLNLVLFVFNLLPFPPLDGYRIIEDLVSADMRAKLTQFEQYGMLVFLIIVLTPLSNYTIDPLFQTVLPFISGTLSQFFSGIFF
ncbi:MULTISPECIES: site-2 protease family protein [Peribacillus]|uniref:site-2 protease family protein n=1 Tax=Peribacillus TaxID=2675229 RepID=UPI00207AA1B1|nr:site-2 protease family protein [Peribacillus asahii]USK70134.1 site-2 protease family protein [Peribacillus asahii]